MGAHVSLVRLNNGRFVFLDAYSLPDETTQEIDELTHGGDEIEAIINVHPFHTIHVVNMHQRYPNARLYGTARHLSRFPELPWEEICSEDPGLHEAYAEDLEFSVPRGVDFISDNEHVHFSSVLVMHRASKTIHVDDTINHIRLPSLVQWVVSDVTSFHPTLSKALEKRAGAAGDFRRWAEELIERWGDAENLCAAHTAILTAAENSGDSIHDRLANALAKADSTLAAHERKYG